MKIIGLLSDFGLRDSYVAEMKAVILSRCPDVRLIDISHEIPKFDVQMGAFVLASATSSFPKGSIFLAVVDPGVGSERMPLIVQSGRSLYVGPDNGLLMLAAFREELRSVYRIETGRYCARAISATFHGRDIFAPVVGDLANDIPVSDIGSPVSNFVEPEFCRPVAKDRSVDCQVLHVDDFGNIVTNVNISDLGEIGLTFGDTVILKRGRKRLKLRFVRIYDEIPEETVGCLLGSHGFLEIAMRMRNASRAIHVRPGSKLTIGA
jgi:S-adenosylmethionine hydrolase